MSFSFDRRIAETCFQSLITDADGAWELADFTEVAAETAKLLYKYPEANNGHIIIDAVYLPMMLYAYYHKKENFDLMKNAYGFNASRYIAYTLAQIALGNFRNQKDKKFDIKNLVVTDERNQIIGTVNARTFKLSPEFIHYADFYNCIDPDECKIDRIKVENRIIPDDADYELHEYPFKITIESNGEVDDFYRESWWEPEFTYQIREDNLYIGLYSDSDFAFSFVPKTIDAINKIYLTNGKIDKCIWEKDR